MQNQIAFLFGKIISQKNSLKRYISIINQIVLVGMCIFTCVNNIKNAFVSLSLEKKGVIRKKGYKFNNIKSRIW